MKRASRLALSLWLAFLSLPELQSAEPLPALTEFTVTSSLDGTKQPSLIWAPESAKSRPTTLFVCLHTWSSGYKQDRTEWFAQAVSRGWIYLKPNFRGRNDHPEAGGSKLARRDILDSMDHVLSEYRVDTNRIYLAGVSGGGHMTMLMAGHHPKRFSAVSAWAGISDLAAWYTFHLKDGKPQRYAQMVAACCGGAPGISKAIDAQYKDRSPLFHLHHTVDLHVDLNAGVNDGHSGSVPIAHTLQAFNVIAKAGGHPQISGREMDELRNQRRLSQPKKSDQVADASYGREIHLRRIAGNARVTIFEGGHEGRTVAACNWLAKQRRKTQRKLKSP